MTGICKINPPANAGGTDKNRAFALRAHCRQDVCAPSTSISLQLNEVLLPRNAFRLGDKSQLGERVMQLVRILDLRPGFFAHSVDRRQIQPADVRRSFRIEPATLENSTCAPFLKRRVIQKGVGPRVQDVAGEWRRQ